MQGSPVRGISLRAWEALLVRIERAAHLHAGRLVDVRGPALVLGVDPETHLVVAARRQRGERPIEQRCGDTPSAEPGKDPEVPTQQASSSAVKLTDTPASSRSTNARTESAGSWPGAPCIPRRRSPNETRSYPTCCRKAPRARSGRAAHPRSSPSGSGCPRDRAGPDRRPATSAASATRTGRVGSRTL